jgi:hypothetical protein
MLLHKVNAKRLLLYFSCFFVASCAQQNTKAPPIVLKDSTKHCNDSLRIDSLAEKENADFYLVQVADGYDYNLLKQKSYAAAEILHSKLDTLDRLYKPNKGIVCPDSCGDEVYCGEYYPRRPFGNQNFVSIEMAYAYEKNQSDTLKMIVFANIFSTKKQADSVTTILKNKIPTSVTVKSNLYLGCMH